MVVVGAIRAAVVDVEGFIREWFLQTIIVNNNEGGRAGTCAHVAAMAVETITMIFAFQLAVRRGHCLFFDRQITTTALIEKG